jgi:hypothetical protein
MRPPQQIHDLLAACRTKPRFPSQVQVSELDSFNAHHQAGKQQLFEKLHSKGLLSFVPGQNGRRTGLGYQTTPKGLAELDLLRRQLKANI